MTTHKIFTRDYILVFLAQFSISFTYNLLIPTLPVYLSKSGAKEEEIGILVGALSVSSLVFRPVVGKALLKIPERRFMLAGALLFALTSFAYLFAPPFWPFFLVRILQGIGIAFFFTASVTFIACISPETHRTQSLSYFYLAYNFSFALAPSFGMFLINLFSFTLLFVLCAAISLGSFFLTSRVQRGQVDSCPDPSISKGSYVSLKALPLAFVAFFAHIIWGAITAFFPLYAIDHGVKNPGFFFGVYALMLILGRSLGAKVLSLHRKKLMLPCLSAYIVAMIILAFSKTLPMFILVAVIWGAGNAFLIPALVAYTLDRAGASRGPAMGTFSAMGDLGVGLGSVIMGVVLELTSYPTMFLCLALTGTINFCYFYFFLQKKEGSMVTTSS